MYAFKKNRPRTSDFHNTDAEESLNEPAKRGKEKNYRQTNNLIAKGSIGSVYNYDNNYVIKDYSGIVEPGRTGRLRKAQNNAAAFNRLYGEGSANVIMHDTGSPYQKQVSVKLKKISGIALDSLLRQGNIALAEHVLEIYQNNDIAAGLAKRLEVNGIDHNDINLGNILYDAETENFNLIDFDDSNINKPGVPLSQFKAKELERKINYYFREFNEGLKKIRNTTLQP